MDINLEKVVAALQQALSKQNPDARVTYEEDVDPNEGQTYRMRGSIYHDLRKGPVFSVNAHSSLYVEFPDGFAVYEISNPEGIDDHNVMFTIRVGKIGAVDKKRVRASNETAPNPAPKRLGLQAVFDSLRKLDPAIPTFEELSEAKRSVFISQVATLCMTMKM